MTENSEHVIGILIKNPEVSGREVFPVSRTVPLTIGRAPDNDVYLSDVWVKRHHCALYGDAEEVYLRAEDRLSNTWVNGTEVHGGCKLEYGDVIVIGKTVFKFDQPATAG